MRSHASGNRPRRLLLVAAVAPAAAFAGGETVWLDVLGGSAGVLDARGNGDPCRDDEEEELSLAHDGIYFWHFESHQSSVTCLKARKTGISRSSG